MSRIHEALKKAEQERASVQGAAGSFPAPDAAEMATDEQVATVGMPSTLGPQALSPSFSSPFNSDTLLSRCPQQEWKADATTMLFLNGNDRAPGTEEFRTLRSRLYHLREKMPL